ncbi:hypothetical protein MAP00_002082 [Monascus purpureus]|nr:hypothetical protein MAP00_002082 [Monascus purpureus]
MFIAFRFLSGLGGSSNQIWRAPIAFVCIPCVILLAGIRWLPESPRFLLMKRKDEKAKAIVLGIHSGPNSQYADFAGAEFDLMKRQLEYDRELNSSFWMS